jgi:hypothetical protein
MLPRTIFGKILGEGVAELILRDVRNGRRLIDDALQLVAVIRPKFGPQGSGARWKPPVQTRIARA